MPDKPRPEDINKPPPGHGDIRPIKIDQNWSSEVDQSKLIPAEKLIPRKPDTTGFGTSDQQVSKVKPSEGSGTTQGASTGPGSILSPGSFFQSFGSPSGSTIQGIGFSTPGQGFVFTQLGQGLSSLLPPTQQQENKSDTAYPIFVCSYISYNSFVEMVNEGAGERKLVIPNCEFRTPFSNLFSPSSFMSTEYYCQYSTNKRLGIIPEVVLTKMTPEYHGTQDQEHRSMMLHRLYGTMSLPYLIPTCLQILDSSRDEDGNVISNGLVGNSLYIGTYDAVYKPRETIQKIRDIIGDSDFVRHAEKVLLDQRTREIIERFVNFGGIPPSVTYSSRYNEIFLPMSMLGYSGVGPNSPLLARVYYTNGFVIASYREFQNESHLLYSPAMIANNVNASVHPSGYGVIVYPVMSLSTEFTFNNADDETIGLLFRSHIGPTNFLPSGDTFLPMPNLVPVRQNITYKIPHGTSDDGRYIAMLRFMPVYKDTYTIPIAYSSFTLFPREASFLDLLSMSYDNYIKFMNNGFHFGTASFDSKSGRLDIKLSGPYLEGVKLSDISISIRPEQGTTVHHSYNKDYNTNLYDFVGIASRGIVLYKESGKYEFVFSPLVDISRKISSGMSFIPLPQYIGAENLSSFPIGIYADINNDGLIILRSNTLVLIGKVDGTYTTKVISSVGETQTIETTSGIGFVVAGADSFSTEKGVYIERPNIVVQSKSKQNNIVGFINTFMLARSCDLKISQGKEIPSKIYTTSFANKFGSVATPGARFSSVIEYNQRPRKKFSLYSKEFENIPWDVLPRKVFDNYVTAWFSMCTHIGDIEIGQFGMPGWSEYGDQIGASDFIANHIRILSIASPFRCIRRGLFVNSTDRIELQNKNNHIREVMWQARKTAETLSLSFSWGDYDFEHGIRRWFPSLGDEMFVRNGEVMKRYRQIQQDTVGLDHNDGYIPIYVWLMRSPISFIPGWDKDMGVIRLIEVLLGNSIWVLRPIMPIAYLLKDEKRYPFIPTILAESRRLAE